MKINDLEKGGFFTTNGKDIWRLVSWFREPSCTLENMDKKTQVETFGMNGLTAQNFHRIEMPEIAQVGEPPVNVRIKRDKV
jgi:hypothetical protein